MIEQFAPHPGPPITWPGTSALNGGKGYVEAPLGQTHFRDMGPQGDDSPLLLLHQCPQSMIEFAEVQNTLACIGRRSIAIDMPGYGLSDHPEVLPSIGGFADNLIAVLDRLGLQKVVVAGHHTGAAIASAIAARHPSRVIGAVLHGLPLYTAEEAALNREKTLWDCTPQPDGSHLSQLFKWARIGDARELANLTWMSIGMLLQSRDIGHWAVDRYDLEADLIRIAAPALILSEVDDMTHHMDQRARVLRPDFQYVEILTPGNSLLIGEPERWTQIVDEFCTGLD